MKILRLQLFFLLLLIPVLLWSQTSWQKIITIEDLCSAYPAKADFIFQNLNLNFPGLEKVKQAYSNGDIRLACRNLLDYYKGSKNIGLKSKEQTPGSQKNTMAADSVLLDIFTFQGISGKVTRLADGRLKWDHTGPENDIEWAWALNRHYPVRPLLTAYETTGDGKYIKYIDNFIKDWIISSWPYPGIKSSTAMWRGLEVSFRVKTWKEIFFRFIGTDLISPATQLLILASLPEHAHYARNFHAQGNWLTMEISGLATVAAYWPEFRESSDWLKYTTGTMVTGMHDQVYPDGVQTELTSAYHHVALANFDQYRRICDEAGIDLPEYFTKTIRDMWNYLALTLRPDGYGILNNDADLADNRASVLHAAEEYSRNDWRYIATNGENGAKPEAGPSYIFPWAGQLISRSGYDKNAQWSFFDIGPWGTGHQHNDKLHISINAYGRDFLVDAGRFAYRGAIADKFRKYASGSQGHNVVLIDGKGQAPGPKLAEKPLPEYQFKISGDFDYAWGAFDRFMDLEGSCKHTRTLFYVRRQYWIVIDKLETDRPRNITTLWHWHPDNLVQKEINGAVSTKNKKGNLVIIPIGKSIWNVTLVKGQEEPVIQGWYSPVYNSFEPGVTAVYSAEISGNKTFVWLLVPSEKKIPVIRAEIVSQNDMEINLRISGPGKSVRSIAIPYSDSRNAGMSLIKK
jgi:hypothetical protein